MATSLRESINSPKIIQEEEEENERLLKYHSDRKSEVGSLHKLKSDLNVLIIAEGWPSWFYAVQGLGFKRIRIRLINTSLSIYHEVK